MNEAAECNWWNPTPGSVMIDVGFGEGTWTLEALAGGAHVVAFDPKPYAMQILMREVAKCGYHRCHAVPVGVWSGRCHKLFGVNSFMDGEGNSFADAEKVWLTSLDDFWTSSLNTTGYIKAINVDCEGSELEVIRGAVGLIRTFYPDMIIECHENYGVTKAQVIAELRSLSYPNVFVEGGKGFVIATLKDPK